jgi:hypothetical protein
MVFQGKSYDEIVEDVKREFLLHLFERFEGDVERIAGSTSWSRAAAFP